MSLMLISIPGAERTDLYGSTMSTATEPADVVYWVDHYDVIQSLGQSGQTLYGSTMSTATEPAYVCLLGAL